MTGGTEYGATISKHRLARRLAALREAAGMTLEAATEAAGWEPRRLRSIEDNSWTSVPVEDVLILARLYEAGDSDRFVIEHLADRCQARPWWRDFPGVFDTEYVGYENDAVAIRGFCPLLLPAQLQTRPYAEAMAAAEPRSPAWRRRAADAVTRRQQVIDRPEPPEFTAVITEAALRSRWGTRADRRAQVLHLLDMSERPGIDLRICTFEAGLVPSLCGTVSILEFAGGPVLVWTDTGPSAELVTSEAAARSRIDTFDRIRETALDPQATAGFLRQLAADTE